MTNLPAYVALTLLIFLALIPPISFIVSNPSFELWPVMILAAGFLGFATLYIRTNWFVKSIAIGTFVLCFFSAAPYVSFTSYVSTVICCYLYILCTKIKNWNIIFRAFQTLLFLNVFIMVMQATGHDTLLNWGLGRDITGFGIIGQHMQMGSFSVVLSAILLPVGLFNLIFPFVTALFCTSSWTILVAGVGTFTILYFKNRNWAGAFLLTGLLLFSMHGMMNGKFEGNALRENGRMWVWDKSMEASLKHPWTGWGPGSYKDLFPAIGLTSHHDIPYKSAHNAPVQLLFETGVPFTLFVLFGLCRLLYLLFITGEVVCLAGVMMILTDMMVHFPDRMLQTVGIIICFLAYCAHRLSLHNLKDATRRHGCHQ